MKPLNERIETMLAELRVIAECKGVTAGPWIPTKDGCSNTGLTFSFIDSGDFACSAAELKDEDATFIASSRTITPLMAEMLILAIEALRHIRLSGEGNSVWAATKSSQDAQSKLTELCDKWEKGNL